MIRLDRLKQDYRDAKNHIYGLAHHVCVDGKEQAFLLNHLGEVETHCLNHGMDGKDIIRELLNPIIDGLHYGNWPWIKNGVNVLEM